MTFVVPLGVGVRVLRGSGAGLIKIKGDKVWRDLTAMDYHYETQPLPNPISYFLHQAPKQIHRYPDPFAWADTYFTLWVPIWTLILC